MIRARKARGTVPFATEKGFGPNRGGPGHAANDHHDRENDAQNQTEF